MKWRDFIAYVLILAFSVIFYMLWYGEKPSEDIWTQFLVIAMGTVILSAVRERA